MTRGRPRLTPGQTTARRGFSAPQPLADALDREAARRGVSFSALVRRILEIYLETKEETK